MLWTTLIAETSKKTHKHKRPMRERERESALWKMKSETTRTEHFKLRARSMKSDCRQTETSEKRQSLTLSWFHMVIYNAWNESRQGRQMWRVNHKGEARTERWLTAILDMNYWKTEVSWVEGVMPEELSAVYIVLWLARKWEECSSQSFTIANAHVKT